MAYEKHETVGVEVGGVMVEVDVLVAPVVRWVNSLPGCEACYSCQGDADASQGRGYVTFRFRELDGLSRVLVEHEGFVGRFGYDPRGIRIMEDSASLEIDAFEGYPRLTIRFHSRKALADFAAWVGA